MGEIYDQSGKLRDTVSPIPPFATAYIFNRPFADNFLLNVTDFECNFDGSLGIRMDVGLIFHWVLWNFLCIYLAVAFGVHEHLKSCDVKTKAIASVSTEDEPHITSPKRVYSSLFCYIHVLHSQWQTLNSSICMADT